MGRNPTGASEHLSPTGDDSDIVQPLMLVHNYFLVRPTNPNVLAIQLTINLLLRVEMGEFGRMRLATG
jgi:hypothetical protein